MACPNVATAPGNWLKTITITTTNSLFLAGVDGWCGPGLPGPRAEQSIALHSDVVSRPARTNESDFQLRGARRCEKTAGQGRAPNSCKLRLF